MKSVRQISAESGIDKKTLFSRISLLNIYPTMEGKRFLLNMEQEKSILTTNLRNRKYNEKLIFDFHERHPELDASDISNTLCVPLRIVESILNKEFLIIESKINKR